jgi:hypothetical protein
LVQTVGIEEKSGSEALASGENLHSASVPDVVLLPRNRCGRLSLIAY